MAIKNIFFKWASNPSNVQSSVKVPGMKKWTLPKDSAHISNACLEPNRKTTVERLCENS